MNYLAHLVIAQHSRTSLVGNFLGDFVKGRVADLDMPDELKLGIAMHRKVDVFTDSHPQVIISRQRISPQRRRFAGIIIDLAFDHLLAKNWISYNKQTLASFVEDFHSLLQHGRETLPEQSLKIIPHLIAGNWLLNYQSIEGVAYAINGISERYRRRFGRENQLLGGVQEVEDNLKSLNDDFETFFPELLRFAKSVDVKQLLEPNRSPTLS